MSLWRSSKPALIDDRPFPLQTRLADSEKSEMDQMGRTNYIFIDFENVQQIDLDRIAGKPVHATLFLGERQKNLPLSLVKSLHKYAGQVTLVETGRTGKNALDLVLAEHIGETRQADPQGYFHIVSRDKDFDSLIGYLKDNGTLAARHDSFAEIPVLMNKDERVKRITKGFKSKQATRPKQRETLESHIQAQFGKTLSPAELENTIKGLITTKVIAILPKGNVTYLT